MLSYSPKYSFLPLAVILLLSALLLIAAYATQSSFLTGPNTLVFAISCLVAALGIISDYLLTREMVYSRYLLRKTFLSARLDRLLGLRNGTDRLFKISAVAFLGSLLGLAYLASLVYLGLNSVPAAGVAGSISCGLMLISTFFYLTAAKITAYRSIHHV
jgi:hypothetical protein